MIPSHPIQVTTLFSNVFHSDASVQIKDIKFMGYGAKATQQKRPSRQRLGTYYQRRLLAAFRVATLTERDLL